MKVTYEELIDFLDAECGSLCMDDQEDRETLAGALLDRFDMSYIMPSDPDDDYYECSEEEPNEEEMN